MQVHTLKTWPEPFFALLTGTKHHEIRKFDRAYNVGDLLLLKQYLPQRDAMMGPKMLAEILYISRPGEWGLPAGEGPGVMSIQPLCVLDRQPVGDDHFPPVMFPLWDWRNACWSWNCLPTKDQATHLQERAFLLGHEAVDCDPTCPGKDESPNDPVWSCTCWQADLRQALAVKANP